MGFKVCTRCGDPASVCPCDESVPDWIVAAAEEIASSTDCCDISSSSAYAIAEVIRRHQPIEPSGK
jgi:hypothetical protein